MLNCDASSVKLRQKVGHDGKPLRNNMGKIIYEVYGDLIFDIPSAAGAPSTHRFPVSFDLDYQTNNQIAFIAETLFDGNKVLNKTITKALGS